MDTQDYANTAEMAFEHLRSHHDESLDRTLLSQSLQRVRLNHFYTNPKNFPENPDLPNDKLENVVTNMIDAPEIIPSNSPINLRGILAMGGDYVARRVEFPRIGDTDHPDIVQINYVNFEGGNIHTIFVLLPDEKFPGGTYDRGPSSGSQQAMMFNYRKKDKPKKSKPFMVGDEYPVQIRVGEK